MYVYICQNSSEGIFTAIYNIYENKHNLPDTRILLEWEPLLMAEYIEVETDAEKSEKVLRTLFRRFGQADTYLIFMAMASPDPEKAESVYRTISYGLANKIQPGHLFDHLADRAILYTHKLALNARRECQHFKGFLRFRELKNGGMYALINPKNDLLPELMEHFSDRFPSEDFLILDEVRNLIGVHKARENWFLTKDPVAFEKIKTTEVSGKQTYYEELFKRFCKTIAIKERGNEDLQKNLLPLRYRTYMTEFL